MVNRSTLGPGVEHSNQVQVSLGGDKSHHVQVRRKWGPGSPGTGEALERTRVNSSWSGAGGYQGQQVQVRPKLGSQSLGYGETQRGTSVTWSR